MTIREKLLEEFGCAISAIYGDLEDKEVEEVGVEKADIDAIARKVKFYLDL